MEGKQHFLEHLFYFRTIQLIGESNKITSEDTWRSHCLFCTPEGEEEMLLG